MEEIKDNEYVRTLQGTIAKIEDSEFDVKYKIPTGKPIYRNWKEDFGGSYVSNEDIVKHSLNLIDLIEVGDYVNGEQIILHNGQKGFYDDDMEEYEFYSLSCIRIKTIVTKEQFKSVMYEV